ncbi:MAG: Arm DNA-binding domain-containing protein [Pedobacter sp.]
MPKRIAPLSDIQVKNAKPQEKDYKLMDGFGLFLLVTPRRLDYRYGNKRNVLAFGAYPAVTLAEARQRREDAKKLLANGVDPGAMKKALKSTNALHAFQNLSEFGNYVFINAVADVDSGDDDGQIIQFCSLRQVFHRINVSILSGSVVRHAPWCRRTPRPVRRRRSAP